MTSYKQNREAPHPGQSSSPLRAAIAALCIFLVLLVGAAHLLHTHPADAPSEASCSLCVVAHLTASPAPVVAGPAIAVLLRTIAPQKPVLASTQSSVLAFCIRPPPALSPHA